MWRTRLVWIAKGERKLLALILVGYLLLASAYSVLLPLWEAPDEPEHFQYVRHLANRRELPLEPLPSIQLDGNEESNQPPLYYALGALLTFWVDTENMRFLRSNPYVTWGEGKLASALALHTEDEAFPYRDAALGAHLVRLLSVGMGALTLATTYRIATTIFPGRPGIALGAAAVNAFTPGFLLSSAVINNDNALILFSTLLLLQMVRLFQGRRHHDLLWLGLWLGLAILSKESALLLLPLVLGQLGYLSWRRGFITWLKESGVVVGVALGLSGWWFLRNYLVYGVLIRKEFSFLPVLGKRLAAITPNSVLGGLKAFFESYWGWFGWIPLHLDPWVYSLLAVVCIASALALLIALFRLWRSHRQPEVAQMSLLLIGALLILFVAVARRELNPVAGNDHARFIFPVISATSLFLLLGLRELMRLLRFRIGVALSLAGLALLAALVPWVYILPSFPSPLPVRSSAQYLRIQHPSQAVFGDRIRLLDYSQGNAEGKVGEGLRITLYWQALEEMEADYTVFLHVVDAQGKLRAQSDGPPAQGRYPTSQWRQGEVIRDEHFLALSPPELPQGSYSLLVGLYSLPSLTRLPLSGSGQGGDALFLQRLDIKG